MSQNCYSSIPLIFFIFFFYQSYFHFIFSSSPCDSCGLYSVHAITPLFNLYLSIFCHVVNLLKLHIFCSCLPHRASPLTLGRAALQNSSGLRQILSLAYLVLNRYSADQELYCCCCVIMHRIMPYAYV